MPFFLSLFLSFGFTYKEGKLLELFRGIQDKVKLKVNYTEGPKQGEFFNEFTSGNFINFDSLILLSGQWSGEFNLTKESIFWTNPNLDKLKLYKVIQFGLYKLFFENKLSQGKLINLEIRQEDVKYSQVLFEVLNNKKQINYWTRAANLNWVETIRGKIFMLNDAELFTVFQTAVYEDKIPIYAFRGEVVLTKVTGDR